MYVMRPTIPSLPIGRPSYNCCAMRMVRSAENRSLRYASCCRVLVIKGGIVQGRYVPAERFDEITKLASREVLIGKIAMMMAHPLTKLLRTLQAPLRNTALLLSQLKDKKPQSV